MNRYLLEYDIYKNDEWQDREIVIIANSEPEAIEELMTMKRRLARNIKVTDIDKKEIIELLEETKDALIDNVYARNKIKKVLTILNR
jgi:hypothetical protein